MLHNHLHHRQVWYHKGLDCDVGIQEGFHLAKDDMILTFFGVVLIYLSVSEFFNDLNPIDIKYQSILYGHIRNLENSIPEILKISSENSKFSSSQMV